MHRGSAHHEHLAFDGNEGKDSGELSENRHATSAAPSDELRRGVHHYEGNGDVQCGGDGDWRDGVRHGDDAGSYDGAQRHSGEGSYDESLYGQQHALGLGECD